MRLPTPPALNATLEPTVYRAWNTVILVNGTEYNATVYEYNYTRELPGGVVVYVQGTLAPDAGSLVVMVFSVTPWNYTVEAAIEADGETLHPRVASMGYAGNLWLQIEYTLTEDPIKGHATLTIRIQPLNLTITLPIQGITTD